jgi:hypothetical protein
MAKLDDWQKEVIRRAPTEPVVVHRLAALFDVTRSCVKKIRNGSRGLPGPNGSGMRTGLRRTRNALEKWRTIQHERIEAAYRRALEKIDRDEAVSVALPPLSRDEALSLMPDKPGVVLLDGALAIKPAAPPPAPTVPMPAKSQAGVFYDRR